MIRETSGVRRVHVADLMNGLVEHPLYNHLTDEVSLRILMKNHVFAVWDFQCLLKALQRSLTCIEVPWLPTGDPEARRLINEIVLDEESDEAPLGGYLSHFELYLDAMKNCGADSTPIEVFLADLREGVSMDKALGRISAYCGAAPFVKTTMEIIRSNEVHRIAAAFTYGREEAIPMMFQQFVERLAGASPARWSNFLYYLHRHITHDADKHGPASRAIVARLCGTEARLWAEAEETARIALRARIELWDNVLNAIISLRREPTA